MNIIISHDYVKYCPECFSSNLIHDFHHAQIYCGDCGLVLWEQVYSNLDNSNYTKEREKELKKHLQTNDTNMTTDNYHYYDYGELINAIHKDIEEAKLIKKAKAKAKARAKAKAKAK